MDFFANREVFNLLMHFILFIYISLLNPLSSAFMNLEHWSVILFNNGRRGIQIQSQRTATHAGINFFAFQITKKYGL